MQDLSLSILGFSAVNRDLTVELRDPVTQNLVREVKPFLDGTVRVPNLDPGSYNLTIRHPNLALPVAVRPIRVLPVGPTRVSVVIDPSKFTNTPIDDIPEANLSPVLDTAKSIAETLVPLAAKAPGEAIRSDDWNAMAGAIRDLAGAVGELTRLVSPRGHDHPELVAKFDEVTGNFQQLVESVSASLTELQREIQIQRVEKQAGDVLDAAGIDPASPRGQEILSPFSKLRAVATASPPVFARETRNAALQVKTHTESLIDAVSAQKPDFATAPAVLGFSAATELMASQRSTTYKTELDHNRLATRLATGVAG